MDAARRLGITKQAIFKRTETGGLITWRSEKQSALMIPVWQFDGDQHVLTGVAEANRELIEKKSLGDYGRLKFLLDRGGPKSPLELIRTGQTETAVKLAHDYGR